MAAEELRRAAEGEPDSAEWHYRLGQALLGCRDFAGAAEALERTIELREDHAYGAPFLRLAEARQAEGRGEAALTAVERYERAYGPTPESTYRKALALRALGKREEAGRQLAEVGRLARETPGYQRGEARSFVLRAFLARFR